MKKSNPQKKRAGKPLVSEKPMPFVSTPSLGHKFRFTSTSVTPTSITRKMLLDLYAYASSATTLNRVIGAVKLKKVTVWSPIVASTYTPQSVSVEWVGTYAPSKLVSDTSQGIRPAVISTRPPKSSSNSWWSISGFNETDTLFVLSAPSGSVIDVDLALRLFEDEAATSSGGSYSGLSTGRMYFNRLDSGSAGIFPALGSVLAV